MRVSIESRVCVYTCSHDYTDRDLQKLMILYVVGITEKAGEQPSFDILHNSAVWRSRKPAPIWGIHKKKTKKQNPTNPNDKTKKLKRREKFSSHLSGM